MASFTVNAQGSHLDRDDSLIIAVEVRDSEGNPVTGLKKTNFKLWQMGHLFSSMTIDTVVPLDSIEELAGYYHIVRQNWSPASNGTFAFNVLVRKARNKGQTLTWVVKVGGGPK